MYICMSCQKISLSLYPPHRGYISFVNTCVTPRNIVLGPWSLGDIWSARNCKRFELYLSVHPSVVITIASERKGLHYSYAGWYWKWAISLHRIHINQTGILGSWAYAISNSHQIWDLGLHINSKCDYQKLSWLDPRFRFFPYMQVN